MHDDKRHPAWFLGTIVTVALLLLGVILVAVITLSARLRQAETATVVRQVTVPIQTAPIEAPSPTSTSSGPRRTTRTTAEPPGGAAAPPMAARRHASAAGPGQMPTKGVQRPVRVVR